MSKQEIRKQLLAQLAALDNQEVDTRITVCMLAGNAWRTIQPVLEALCVQGERIDVLVGSDQKASDPTRVILKDCVTYLPGSSGGTIRSFRYVGEFPHNDGLENMLAMAKASMVAEVETEWVFFLDADVLLDPGTLRAVYNIAKEDNETGAWCVQYAPVAEHIQWGCTLMRTEIAREIGFSGVGQCGCKNLHKDLENHGLRMLLVEGITAQHLNRGQIRTVVIGG